MLKRQFELIGMLALAVILVPGLLQAGEVQVGGQGGPSNPPGDICGQDGANCDVDIDWNPSVHCSGYTILADLLDCMLYELDPQQNAPEDFTTGLLSEGWGISVHRKGWMWFPPPGHPTEEEIQRLEIYENTLGIGTTQLRIDRSKLVARIGGIVEEPDSEGGVIEIQLDDDILDAAEEALLGLPVDTSVCIEEFDTETYTMAINLTLAISQWLRSDCGFDVVYDGGYFVITNAAGFRRVLFRSDNGHEGGLGPQVLGVVSSDIALLPKDDPEVEHLFP